ncbi:MAG: molybdopterin molybdotransferase MoeA [Alphaproteobacteria bacterium]|nr:molybdopterin molybdotransferase MoeA [Alphaproteobacteria bacterium]
MTDAFAPAREMLRADEAVTALLAAIHPVAETESVKLFEAPGRVLAADLAARRTQPPFDNSAMDGYALRAADLDGAETRLKVTGRIAAGDPPGQILKPGEAFRIFTGAPIPVGGDGVVMQEDCRFEDGFVTLRPTKRGANVRPAGEDFMRGDIVLTAGKRLLPQDVGHAAAAGHAALTVRRRPRVALFATGDEVREPGQDDTPGTIVNSNTYVLHGLLRRLGCEPVWEGIAPDRPDALRALLSGAASRGVDAILTTGGVSMGEEDHVKGAVEALGALHFWRIAIRPGRPLAFGHVAGTPFVGLPGNPVAAMVTFLIFARPMLLRLAGAPFSPPQSYPVAADFAFRKKPGRREWLRGHLRPGPDGGLVARRFPNEGSGIFTSVVASTGLIELADERGDIRPGDTVPFLPFSEML